MEPKVQIMNEMMDLCAANDYDLPPVLAKWSKHVNVINEAFEGKLDYSRQASIAIMFESAMKHINRYAHMLNESTQPVDVGYFKKYAINLLAAAIPNLIAPDIVSMQPIDISVASLS